MKTILLVISVFGFSPCQAMAALNVFACEPEWGALAQELGGDKVSVYNATTAQQDPHRIEARPSLIARARNADLMICSGSDLEIGWVPLLLTQSGNEKEDELKTDHTALELVSFAGYDPAEYEKLLTALGPGNGITSSHPPVEERVAALTALRQGELKDFATGAAKPDLASVFAPLGK